MEEGLSLNLYWGKKENRGTSWAILCNKFDNLDEI